MNLFWSTSFINTRNTPFSGSFCALPLAMDLQPQELDGPHGNGVAIHAETACPSTAVDQHSTPDAKIALFRSLFRGREDVYPRRFESRKTGKSGYSPVCANEWVRDLCDKRVVQCGKCANRRFLPMTDEVVRLHLTGQDDRGREFVMGVYPMLLDETCHFLAADIRSCCQPAPCRGGLPKFRFR